MKRSVKKQNTKKSWLKELWAKPVIIVLVSGLFIAFLHAIFSSTLSLIIDTNYSETLHLFGIVLSSTALAGILQSAPFMVNL